MLYQAYINEAQNPVFTIKAYLLILNITRLYYIDENRIAFN